MKSAIEDGVWGDPKNIAGTNMKPVQFYSPYGYRAKIGLIIPSTNTINEPEFNMLSPNGISIS